MTTRPPRPSSEREAGASGSVRSEPEELQSEPYIEVELPQAKAAAFRGEPLPEGGRARRATAELGASRDDDHVSDNRMQVLISALRSGADAEHTASTEAEASAAGLDPEGIGTDASPLTRVAVQAELKVDSQAAGAGGEDELSGEELQELATPPPVPGHETPFSVADRDDEPSRDLRVRMAAAAASAAAPGGIDVMTSAPAVQALDQEVGAASDGFAAARSLASGAPASRRNDDWFETAFDEDYLRTMRFATAEWTAREVDFLQQVLELSPSSEIIDLGCGPGRHCIELAARGYQHVTGVDLSLPLLIRGADISQRRGLKVNFVHGDLREIDYDEAYDAAICLNTTFGYFEDETNRRVLQSVCQALRPGGRVVVDVVNRDYAVQGLPCRVGWEGDGCVVLEEVDFNFFSSRMNSRRSIVFADGRHVEHEISIRCYSLHELGKLIHHAGLRVLEVSGHVACRGRFFGQHSPLLMVLAEKRA